MRERLPQAATMCSGNHLNRNCNRAVGSGLLQVDQLLHERDHRHVAPPIFIVSHGVPFAEDVRPNERGAFTVDGKQRLRAEPISMLRIPFGVVEVFAKEFDNPFRRAKDDPDIHRYLD